MMIHYTLINLPPSPFFYDHVTRYWWAGQYTKNKTVLDCASGKGYGAYIMSHHAKHVTGVDLNEESLRIAKDNFSQPNLSFKKNDILSLKSLNEKFDVITAFEAIEHLPSNSSDLFLTSIKSVLKSNGTFLISTPNHDVVLKSGSSVPEFHINNFKSTELQTLLKKHFSQVQMIGQYKPKGYFYNILFSLDIFNLRHSLKSFIRKPTLLQSTNKTP